jgi:signal transduction histidine kinase
MREYNDGFCQFLVFKSKALLLILLLVLGLVLEFVVHYVLRISVVYTHLFYLIIIIAALWYQKKVVWVALFFGVLHILVTYLVQGSISPDSVFRAIMLCIIAYIGGSLVSCVTLFREEEIRQKIELEKTQAAYQMANKKLNILSSITRHDILNQLTVLLGYLEISQETCTDPALLEFMKKEQEAAYTIRREIEFTKDYQDIGVRAPVWHNLIALFQKMQSTFHSETVILQSALAQIEIYADPLFPRICENLIDNSIRHGEHVTSILFSSEQTGNQLTLIYQDDGVGVPDQEKENIFSRGFGKHTGMGLFLSQEILAITELSMRETGVTGKGVRFEIIIPEGSFRIIE